MCPSGYTRTHLAKTNMKMKRFRPVFFVTLFCYGLLQLVTTLRYDIGLYDEGYQFYLAWAVGQKSQVLYQDIFTSYAPGYVWSLIAFLEIFEYSFFWYRVYDSILVIAIICLMYIVVDKLTESWWSPLYSTAFIVLAWIPIYPGGKASRIIFLFAYIYLGSFILYKGASRGRIVGLGLVVTAAGLMSQEIGGFLTISTIVLLLLLYFNEIKNYNLKNISQNFIIFVGTGLVGTTPVILYYSTKGSLSYLVHDLVFALFSFSDAMGRSMVKQILRPLYIFEFTLGGIFSAGFYSVYSVLFLLPPALFVITATHLFSRYKKDSGWSKNAHVLIWITTLSALFYIIALGRSDTSHLAVAIVPSIILMAILVDSWWVETKFNFTNIITKSKNIDIKQVAILGVVICLLLAPAGAGQVMFLLGSYNPSANYVDSDLQTTNHLQIPEEEYQQISQTVDEVEAITDSNDTVIALPYTPGYYPITNRTTPTRHSSFLPGELGEQDVTDLIEKMNEERVLVIYRLDRSISTHQGDLELQDYHPRLHRHIVEECELTNEINNHSKIYIC